MAEVESDSDAPPGFNAVTFAGIGMVARMLEPHDLANTDDWKSLVARLESWGEVPDPDSIVSISTASTNRGLVAKLSTDSDWSAEFLPWGSDGRLRARAKAAPKGSRVPSGGYSWQGTDLIIIRSADSTSTDSASEITRALMADEMGTAQEELRNAGRVLGHYHTKAMAARTTPPDTSRWNARNQWLEEALRATFLWRAPYSKDQPCTLTLTDVRFCDISGDSLRIGRPRLADALHIPNCEFPAMRDLASLVHDLSRLHHSSSSSLELIPLRLALIEGWKSTAPQDWTSNDAFYAHRGGLAIWEYEQCLMDVLEATSYQSGAPETAVNILRYVQSYQKRMFGNRIFEGLALIGAFFGTASLVNTFPWTLGEVVLPLSFIAASFVCIQVYRRLSPPPERPFTYLGK
jgi:hypothetical protein